MRHCSLTNSKTFWQIRMPALELTFDVLTYGRYLRWRRFIFSAKKCPSDDKHDTTKITPPMEHAGQVPLYRVQLFGVWRPTIMRILMGYRWSWSVGRFDISMPRGVQKSRAGKELIG